MTIIHVSPLTLWAKNRVRQHGWRYEVLRRAVGRVLVKSLGKTWRLKPGAEPDHWMAWFVVGVDVEIVEEA